jgi:hypothetical protein
LIDECIKGKEIAIAIIPTTPNKISIMPKPSEAREKSTLVILSPNLRIAIPAANRAMQENKIIIFHAPWEIN